MPEGINLVVAVSFGLFVPPRILRGAKYGGLNVHPSWLPECVLNPSPPCRFSACTCISMLRAD